MKESSATIVLLLVALLSCSIGFVNGQCSLFEEFGDSLTDADAIENDEVDFRVDVGQTATCTLSCDSGGNSRLALRYDDGATGTCVPIPNTDDCDDGDRYYTDCNFAVTTRAAAEQTETLGYRFVVNGGYKNLKLNCTCSGSYTPTDDGLLDTSCFSASTLVHVQDKGEVLMQDLKVGDRVLTGKNTFEQVYTFGHKHKDSKAEFYQIFTDNNSGDDTPSLEMTGAHLAFVVNQDSNDVSYARAIRADQIQTGDKLLVTTSKGTKMTAEVTKIAKIIQQGLYMPLVVGDGTIVVGNNKVVASAYVSIADDAPKVVSNIVTFFGLSEHHLSHWWLSPYRMMCRGVSTKYCGGDDSSSSHYNEEGILNWLVMGQKLAQFVEPLGVVMSIGLVGVPIFLIFAFLNLVESLLGGPTLAPLVVATIGMGTVYGLSLFRCWREGAHNKKEKMI